MEDSQPYFSPVLVELNKAAHELVRMTSQALSEAETKMAIVMMYELLRSVDEAMRTGREYEFVPKRPTNEVALSMQQAQARLAKVRGR